MPDPDVPVAALGPSERPASDRGDDNREAKERLNYLTRCMQTAVAATYQAELLEKGVPEWLASELKHLRVGINAAMSEHAALTELLMEKGVITSAEYLSACIHLMEREIQLHQAVAARRYGSNINFGPAGLGTEGNDARS